MRCWKETWRPRRWSTDTCWESMGRARRHQAGRAAQGRWLLVAGNPADGTAPSQFRADFTSAQFRNMAPFAIVSSHPYESAGPPSLESLAYAGALAEVQSLGDGNIPND